MEDLRRRIADLRKKLAPAELEARSAKAVLHLTDWLIKNVSTGGLVGLYAPANPNRLGEIDPSGISPTGVLSKIHFAYPRVLDRFHRIMDFSLAIHPSDWVKGVYGNREPRPELPSVDPRDFDVIVVPGVVFGISGERIGMGAGFYDRYLANSSGALRIGLGFDFQLLADGVPQADWDARMDVVITDLRVVETAVRPMV